MNIIIPLAGSGKRFSEEGYTLPKPLIKSLGKQIIFWNIESLKVQDTDTVYIVYRQEFNKFNFQDLLKNNFRKLNFKFISVQDNTRGAAETVLHALEHINIKDIDQLTIVIDSDNCYEDDIIGMAKESNDNTVFYTENKDLQPIYSYIQIHENRVTAIAEKQKISDNICVGAYCFKTASSLMQCIKDTIKLNNKQNNEYYVSSLYQTLLQQNVDVYCRKISNFKCLGTPNQLKSHSSNICASAQKYRFCFDLDNTLVTFPVVEGEYDTVKPIQKNIDFLNNLYEQGHNITIHTARRMRTHKGNVGAVQADIGLITLNTLKEFNINYHEIYFGKPHAHFYIDDLAVSVFDDLEKETGFYNTHPKTRKHNSIEIFNDCIIKHSTNLSGELFYYKNIPKVLESYFPKLIDCSDDFIKIEKINGIPLSSLHYNKLLNTDYLNNLLNSLKSIHAIEIDNTQSINIYKNYNDKIQKRYTEYDYSRFKSAQQVKEKITSYLKDYEESDRGKCGIIHGDPVLTNVLLDTNDKLKFIDMRGKQGDVLTIYGDIFYDYAKVYQSLLGYDYILMDKEIDTELVKADKEIFKEFIIKHYDITYLEAIQHITMSLLFTLIPIHDNDKCFKYYELIDECAF